MTRFRLRFLMHEIDLVGPSLQIGRSSSCYITLDDPMVSRRHARIEIEDNGAFLVDLASRNGVLVNGIPLRTRARLIDGDTIRIGSQDMTFVVAGANAVPKRPTGHLRICAECNTPYATSSAQCVHCGTIEGEESTYTGDTDNGSTGSVWTLHLLSDVVESALKSRRYAHAERMLSRGAVDLERSIESGIALDVAMLNRLLVNCVRLSVAVGHPHWLGWTATVFEKLGLPPSDEVLEEAKISRLPADPGFQHEATRLHRLARHSLYPPTLAVGHSR